MTALPDTPRIRPTRPANHTRPPLSAADRRALIETETLAGAIESLDRARLRDRTPTNDVAHLAATPVPTAVEDMQPADESLEYRIMSSLAALIGGAAVIVVGIFAISLIADLPGLLTRGIMP